MITELNKRVLKKYKPKAKKRPLKEDFITVRTPADNEKGYTDKRVYSGPLVAWRDESDKKRITAVGILGAAQLLLMLVGVLRLFTANLFIPVSLLKLLALPTTAWQLLGVMMLVTGGRTIPERDHLFIRRSLRVAPWITAVLTLFAVIGNIWALFQIFDLGSVIAGLLTAASGGAAVWAYYVYKSIVYGKVRNTAKDGLKELNDKTTGRATGIYVPRHSKKR